jgi:hypothetical protein
MKFKARKSKFKSGDFLATDGTQINTDGERKCERAEYDGRRALGENFKFEDLRFQRWWIRGRAGRFFNRMRLGEGRMRG